MVLLPGSLPGCGRWYWCAWRWAEQPLFFSAPTVTNAREPPRAASVRLRMDIPAAISLRWAVSLATLSTNKCTEINTSCCSPTVGKGRLILPLLQSLFERIIARFCRWWCVETAWAYGASQGAVLSPRLLHVCMKLWGGVTRRFGLSFHQYVDDTLL